MIFVIKNGPILVASFGVQLSTHDFLLHFCSFFCPFPRGPAGFCPVFWSRVPTKHGGERVVFCFFCQIRGAERLLPNFSAKHGGQMGVKYVVPFCFSCGVFGCFRWQQGMHARRSRRKRKRRNRRRRRKRKRKNPKKKRKKIRKTTRKRT